jgi:hypothetical protein
MASLAGTAPRPVGVRPLKPSRHNSPSTSLRPIGMPRALVVRTDDAGMPGAVSWRDARGRRSTEAHVDHIEEMWRIAEAWWREAPQARTYFRVILETGRPLTLYRDDLTGDWYEQEYTAPHPRSDHR